MKLSDVLTEVLIGGQVIVEVEAAVQPGTPAGTEVNVPTIRVRINGRPMDINVKVTTR